MPSARFSVAFVLTAGLLLSGCFDRFTQLVFFPHSQFVTIDDVDLRSGQDDESALVGHLPKGTIVVPIGQMGSECNSCWRVNTPEGIGWLYTRYLAPTTLEN